jgi:hypothetical protein
VGRVVCGGSWIVVDDGGAGRVVSSSVRRVQRNAPVRPRVTAFPGLYTVSVCRLRRAGESLGLWVLPGCWPRP